MKRIEYRSRPTRRIGQRFYIYASKQWAAGKLLLAGCGPVEGGRQTNPPPPWPSPWVQGEGKKALAVSLEFIAVAAVVAASRFGIRS